MKKMLVILAAVAIGAAFVNCGGSGGSGSTDSGALQTCNGSGLRWQIEFYNGGTFDATKSDSPSNGFVNAAPPCGPWPMSTSTARERTSSSPWAKTRAKPVSCTICC